MRLLTLGEVIVLHQRVIEETGGAAVAQPRATFDSKDL